MRADFIIRTKNAFILYKIFLYIIHSILHYFSLLNFCLYRNCDVATTFWKANNPEYAKNLWNVSCQLLQLEPKEDFATFLEIVSRKML